MAKKFGKTEKDLESLFSKGTSFSFNNEKLEVLLVGKPSTPKGECKTDLYILAKNTKQKEIEFKISIKQANADFLENKMQLSRAIEIFGKDAQNIIKNSIAPIEEQFRKESLIYFEKKSKTEKCCITLGWKFELLNKLSGSKSGKMELNKHQKIDAYSGTNLNIDKRNCSVKGGQIKDSGVANYILVIENEIDKEANYYASKFEAIDEYAGKSEIYFACKALNYRATPNKWDGNRPLAVYVNWELKNDLITANLVFNKPLEICGNEVGENVQDILKKLKINHTNFEKLKSSISKDVNIHHSENNT